MLETTVQNGTRRTWDGLKKNAGMVALVTGGVAAGYATYRFIRSRTAQARERERELNEWLATRMDILQETLGLDPEKLEWLRNEAHSLAQTIHKLQRVAGHLRPSIHELIDIGSEKQFVKLRLKVHKNLKLTADRELRALHQFYDDFRRRFLADPLPIPTFAMEDEA